MMIERFQRTEVIDKAVLIDNGDDIKINRYKCLLGGVQIKFTLLKNKLYRNCTNQDDTELTREIYKCYTTELGHRKVGNIYYMIKDDEYLAVDFDTMTVYLQINMDPVLAMLTC